MRIAVLLTVFLAASRVVSGQNSVLSSGMWYKVAVQKSGVYKISQSLFRQMGFPPTTDPRKIRIFGYPTGMLPQRNSASRPEDLTELAIWIPGEEDGVFHARDAIYFYAQGPDQSWYDPERERFGYEKNLYDDFNYYFITVGPNHGRRITTLNDAGPGHPVVNTYENFVYHEVDQHNELKSGRVWFGERFDLTTEISFRLNLPGIVPSSTIKWVSEVMGQSFQPTSFQLYCNQVPVGVQPIDPVPNDRYGIKGHVHCDTFYLSESAVQASANSVLNLRYVYQKSPSTRSVGYLNFFLLQTRQFLSWTGHQIIFRSQSSLANTVSEYRLANSRPDIRVWNITSPFEPALQLSRFENGATVFAASSSVLQTYIVFDSQVPAPVLTGRVPNQNLRGIPPSNLIIVTHEKFMQEARRLAQHRQSVSGMTTVVVSTAQIFHEFSGGRQDVTAIRDFVRFQYEKDPATLKALLLFGKGSYDYRNILKHNLYSVPTYQSRNSLHPLLTYSSDDYFGFLESHEGEWTESPPINHTLDIAVGRLPVKTHEEARNVVDKIIHYETQPDLNRPWRKTFAFVADDGDNNLHVAHADFLAEYVEEDHAYIDVRKLYLDAFAQTSGAAGHFAAEARKELEKIFHQGALIINYSGHGSERQWAQERILDELFISSLKNDRLPLLVTATCEFGRQDDPAFSSGAELLLLRPRSGAIALVTTSRPVFASNNFFLNQAFYQALFQVSPRPVTLGEVFRITKNNSLSGVANRNFSLIGDPALQLMLPDNLIHIQSITNQDNSDTLRALSRVHIVGQIRRTDHSVNTSFNGLVHITVFDKKSNRLTLGNENPPFSFSEFSTVLFNGKATVENGLFSCTFTVPRSINYTVGNGKLSVYAYTDAAREFAAGYSKSFKIGGSEVNYPSDNIPPFIELFVGDTTFVPGNRVPSNTVLIARFQDDSGISLSDYGIGNELIGILNDREVFSLVRHYESLPDDPTRGIVLYPLRNLQPGHHRLTVQAWDTHNNPASASIDFTVDGGGLYITSFDAFPNPFTEQCTIRFTHNRTGENLEAMVEVLSPAGRSILQRTFRVDRSPFRVDLHTLIPEEIPENIFVPGLYLIRLAVRSFSDGSKNEQVTRVLYVK